jgi:hypothetical protein
VDVGVGIGHLDQLGYPDTDSRLPNHANASTIDPWTAQTAVNGHRRQNIHNPTVKMRMKIKSSLLRTTK